MMSNFQLNLGYCGNYVVRFCLLFKDSIFSSLFWYHTGEQRRVVSLLIDVEEVQVSSLNTLLLVEAPTLASTDISLVEKGRNASLLLSVLCPLTWWGVAPLLPGSGESPNPPLGLFWRHPGLLLPAESGTPSSPLSLHGTESGRRLFANQQGW